MRFAALLCLPLLLHRLCPWPSRRSHSRARPQHPRQRARSASSPIVGSHVYLFAANTTGYGGPGNRSVRSQRLSLTPQRNQHGVLADSMGAYVITDGSQFLAITGDYACTPNTQVYLYSLGGDPRRRLEFLAAGLLAALGNCPSSRLLPRICFHSS